MNIVVGLPRLGIYSAKVREFFESLGLKVVQPPKITPEIIKLGVMNSSDMICFPYKVTLGEHIYNLEHGATDLIMWDTAGLCRFKHYHSLHDLTLRDLGYTFRMHTLTIENLLPTLVELSGQNALQVLASLVQAYPAMLELEKEAYGFLPERELKIGIVGELYTILENDINFDIIRKLQKAGANVDVSVKLSDLAGDFLGRGEGKEEEKEEALKLLPQEIGGHGFHTIYNTIWYAKHGFDGIIHLMPLSCMPESTVEAIINHIVDKHEMPLYRFPIDEANSEQGFLIRIETFVSMLKRRKRKA